jgi:hypothetical protein
VQILHARERQILHSLEVQNLHSGCLDAKISCSPGCDFCILANMQKFPSGQDAKIAFRPGGRNFTRACWQILHIGLNAKSACWRCFVVFCCLFFAEAQKINNKTPQSTPC